VLRLQYPYATGTWLVEPFAFGGVGWTQFSLDDATGRTIGDSEVVFTMPVGGGVTLGYNRLLLDTRFTYRPVFNENLIRESDGSAANLDNWAITASLGYRF
jgi:hypothetical protein